MLQHVNTVLIAKSVSSASDASSLKNGEVALFDENKNIISDADAAKAAKALYIGVCEGTETVTALDGTQSSQPVVNYSMPILKGAVDSLVVSPFVEKAEDKIVITATGVTPEVGHRYVLRLVYNDIYEHPGQFTHTYEVIAKTTSAEDLIASLVKKVNKHKEARVTATAEGAVLTLEAKEIPYNEGITIDALYSQVSVDAFMWKTIPSGILSNMQYPIANLTIAKTQGTPGKGNAKIVRDRENAALGYRGITHRANGIYPYIAPEFKSDLDAEYDTLVVEWHNKYLSDDNQYIKSTPLAVELYVEKGKLASSDIESNIKAFIG
jgi:hypothetical protein